MEPRTQLNDERPGKTPTEELIELPHDEMIKRMLEERPEMRAAYEEKGRQIDYFFMECVRARKRAGMTQKDVAERLGVTEPTIWSLESYYPGRKRAPKFATLQRYAEALGSRLVIKLEPLEEIQEENSMKIYFTEASEIRVQNPEWMELSRKVAFFTSLFERDPDLIFYGKWKTVKDEEDLIINDSDELMDIAWGEVLDLQECKGFLEDGHTFWILYREGLDIRVEPVGEDSFIAMR